MVVVVGVITTSVLSNVIVGWRVVQVLRQLFNNLCLSLLDEPRGAADSSDEISGVATPSPASTVSPSVEDTPADQPSCSEGEPGVVTDKQEEEQVGEGNSPDQSDTAQ